MSTALATAGLMGLSALCPLQAPDLGATAARVAALWSQADVVGLAELGASEGIRLQRFDQRYLPVSGRQASAALREFFAARRTGGARVTRLADVGGQPARAFAELDWTPDPEGPAGPERFVLFVGLTLEGAGWRISEIRLLR